MKKLLYIVLALLPFFSFSQEQFSFKSGGRVFNSNSQKLTTTEVRATLESNSQALKLYNAGRTKKTVGNIFLYGGISTIITTHLVRVTDSNTFDQFGRPTSKTRSNTMYFVGAGVVLIAIPIKIGFTKKIKKSLELINQDFKNPKTSFNIDSTTFISNSNGFGISITF